LEERTGVAKHNGGVEHHTVAAFAKLQIDTQMSVILLRLCTKHFEGSVKLWCEPLESKYFCPFFAPQKLWSTNANSVVGVRRHLQCTLAKQSREIAI
jgi:hypothetical protein